jgi:hypothetical protein
MSLNEKSSWSGEDELLIADSLEWDSFKAVSQISRETGIFEEKVAQVLDHLIENKFAIEKKGMLYRYLDLDNLEEIFEDE